MMQVYQCWASAKSENSEYRMSNTEYPIMKERQQQKRTLWPRLRRVFKVWHPDPGIP
jgi:hypothetical protein